MKLSEFISNTLVDISTGVSTAQKESQKLGLQIAINPYLVDDPSHSRKDTISEVKFDIAVSSGESSSTDGGGGINVLNVVSLQGKGIKQSERGLVNRIEFSVPLMLPIYELKESPE